jgi:hypothetical protein
MAMEHFEEKIAPTLKTRLPALPLPYPFNDSCSSPETSGEEIIKSTPAHLQYVKIFVSKKEYLTNVPVKKMPVLHNNANRDFMHLI